MIPIFSFENNVLYRSCAFRAKALLVLSALLILPSGAHADLGPVAVRWNASPGNEARPDVDSGAEESQRARYTRLEEKRRTLQRRLNRLRHLLSGRELPVEQARVTRERMAAGFRLLHNPLLLGGFRDQQHLQSELQRVDYSDTQLQEVEQWLIEEEKTD